MRCHACNAEMKMPIYMVSTSTGGHSEPYAVAAVYSADDPSLDVKKCEAVCSHQCVLTLLSEAMHKAFTPQMRRAVHCAGEGYKDG